MSFLNRSVLQERAAAATVEKHPLLKECDVPPNVKQAYLQGCVLAVLERDDGKVTDAARQELLKLGKSLELSDADCAEAISIVSALQTSEDQGQFLDELFAVLAGNVYPRFFMVDFESLLKKGGELTADVTQLLDYVGMSLTKQELWRSVCTTGNLPTREATIVDDASHLKEQLPVAQSAGNGGRTQWTHEEVVLQLKNQLPYGATYSDYAAYVRDLYRRAEQGDQVSGSLVRHFEAHSSRLVDLLDTDGRFKCFAKLLSETCGLNEWTITSEGDFFDDYSLGKADVARFLNQVCMFFDVHVDGRELNGIRSIQELDEAVKYQRSVTAGVVKHHACPAVGFDWVGGFVKGVLVR